MKFTYTLNFDTNSHSFSIDEMFVLFKSSEFKSIQRTANKLIKVKSHITPGDNITFNNEVKHLWEDQTKINKYITDNNLGNVNIVNIFPNHANCLITDIEAINNQNIDNYPITKFKIAPIKLLLSYMNQHHLSEKLVDINEDWCVVTDEVMTILKVNQVQSQVLNTTFNVMYSLNKARAKQQLQYESYKNLEYSINNNIKIIDYRHFVEDIHKSYTILDQAGVDNLKQMFESTDEKDQELAARLIGNVNRTDKNSLDKLTELFFFHGSKCKFKPQELIELEYYMRHFVFTRRQEKGY